MVGCDVGCLSGFVVLCDGFWIEVGSIEGYCWIVVGFCCGGCKFVVEWMFGEIDVCWCVCGFDVFVDCDCVVVIWCIGVEFLCYVVVYVFVEELLGFFECDCWFYVVVEDIWIWDIYLWFEVVIVFFEVVWFEFESF